MFMKLRAGLLAVAAGAGYLALARQRRRSRPDLSGKVVLITGGSRGLGLALAREFGSRGAIVTICARQEDELRRAREDLATRGVRSHTFVCDVTDRSQVLATVAAITEQVGDID